MVVPSLGLGALTAGLILGIICCRSSRRSCATFRYSRQFSDVNCASALAASLSEALRATGLPQ
jgi:hypothetical protein